jgi:hypothetical protein
MRQEQEDLTRALASALWRSALSPYCSAVDNWLAAEAMVAEAARAAEEAPLEPEPKAVAVPSMSIPAPAFPVQQVRDLAQCFWDHSARSAALTLDIWLAAERHVLAFCHAMLSGGGTREPFSAAAHWQRIRDHAEWLWLERGRPRDRDLEIWLKAEAEVLAQSSAGSSGRAAAMVSEDNGRGPGAGTARRPLALTMLDEDRAPTLPPPAGREHPGAWPSLS